MGHLLAMNDLYGYKYLRNNIFVLRQEDQDTDFVPVESER